MMVKYRIVDISEPTPDADIRVAMIEPIKESSPALLLNLNALTQESNKASGAFLREDRTLIADAGLIILSEMSSKPLWQWERDDILFEE